jgi:hypothetical protein
MALFYYLRIIVVLFAAPSENPLPTAGGAIPRISAAVLTVLTAVLIGLGIYPTPLIETVRNVASSLLLDSSTGPFKMMLRAGDSGRLVQVGTARWGGLGQGSQA